MRRHVTLLCLLAMAVMAPAARAATCSGAFCTLDMNSRIWINNNTWGADASPAGWSESVTTLGTNSFRMDFNWPTGSNNNSVKAYPSAVLGWHWGWHFPTGTGLPRQLSANQNINTSYNYTASFGSGGTANVAYDIWLHTQSNPLFETPSDEIMIWVNRTGGAGPIGGTIATVNIDGATWELHRGNIGWEVWSFVRTSNSGSGSLNIKSFTDYLRNTWGLSSAKYVTSVEFGSEIFHGTGNVNVSNYTCTVGGGGGGGGGGGIIANGTYRVLARHSGQGLDVSGHGTADGANVVQWPYGGGNNQRWTLTHLGSNVYQIMGVESGKALESASTSTANGLNVDIRTYTGASNQRWTISATSGGYFRLSPVHSAGSCLDVAGASTANGANVQQWVCTGGNNQQWTFQAP
jgi:hypothetical protein